MRTQELFALVRQKVNDRADSTNPEGRYHPNFDIQQLVTTWMRELVLDQVEADRSWHNVIFNIPESDAIQDSARVFNYSLPPFIYRVSMVREDNVPKAPHGRKLQPVAEGTDRRGWYWLDSQRIFIQGETAALDLRVWGTKVPPHVHFGQIREAHIDQDKFYLDHLPAATGNQALEISPDDNAYAGMYFVFTGTAGTPVITHDIGGEVKRCISSQRIWVAAVNMYLTEITLDSNLSQIAALEDTYEMVIPVAAPHTGYLSVLVAESLHQRTNNTNGIEALQRQKLELHSRFINGIQPRQDQAPWENQFPEESQVGDFDPDRDPWALYYGTTF